MHQDNFIVIDMESFVMIDMESFIRIDTESFIRIDRERFKEYITKYVVLKKSKMVRLSVYCVLFFDIYVREQFC